MQINFNGKEIKIAEDTTIAKLIVDFALDIDAIAIEHNLNIVPREEYAEVVLQEGDSLEAVEFVGGG